MGRACLPSDSLCTPAQPSHQCLHFSSCEREYSSCTAKAHIDKFTHFSATKLQPTATMWCWLPGPVCMEVPGHSTCRGEYSLMGRYANARNHTWRQQTQPLHPDSHSHSHALRPSRDCATTHAFMNLQRHTIFVTLRQQHQRHVENSWIVLSACNTLLMRQPSSLCSSALL